MPHEWDDTTTEYGFEVKGVSPREEVLIREAVKKAHKRAAACVDAVKEYWDSVEYICELLDDDRDHEAREAFSELDEEAQMALNLAYTKGGWFTTEQRAKLRGN